jgi:hypothetical protein
MQLHLEKLYYLSLQNDESELHQEMLLSGRRKNLSEGQHDESEKHVSAGSTTKRELLEAMRSQYLKANKVEICRVGQRRGHGI